MDVTFIGVILRRCEWNETETEQTESFNTNFSINSYILGLGHGKVKPIVVYFIYKS